MKTLKEIVLEKLILNKSSKKHEAEQLEPIDRNVEINIRNAIWDRNPSASYKHHEKMEGYMKKGSDPKRLIATIKDDKKLINRWYAAIDLEWDDAILSFGDAVSKRLGFKLTELHQYIYKLYTQSRSGHMHDAYIHYLDLYNIKHDETN